MRLAARLVWNARQQRTRPPLSKGLPAPAKRARPAPAALAVLALGLGGVGLAGLGLAGAPEAAAQSTKDTQRRLEAGRQQLDERNRAEQGLAADVGQLRLEREQLNQSLVETARLIQKGEGQLSSIEARMGELEAQEKLLKGSLAQRHDQIARLLAAMQRMGRNPPPVMITRREDALQMVRSAMMLASAFPEMRDQALALAGRLTELARVMDDIKSEGDKLKTETARLSDGRTRLAQLMETKRQSIAERQGELDKVRREAVEIARSVEDLNELIARLDKAVSAHTGQDLTGRTPPAPAETPVAAAPSPPAAATPPAVEAAPPVVAAPAAVPSPPQAVAAAPVPPAKPPAAVAPKAPERQVAAIEIAPKGSHVATLDPGRLKPARPFDQTRGQLQMPAQGRRVIAFSEKMQHGGQSKGIVIETRHSAQVTAPADAWVVFAGEFRTFGQLLIINAGDGYHILLAGLSQIDVQLGEFVLAGQPVGVMSGAAKGGKAKAADNAPVLYIEFRKDSRPIDPAPWWSPEGSQKVQG